MIKNKLVVLSMAAALAMPLAACGGNAATPATDGGSDAPAAAAGAVNTDLVGQWHGTVTSTEPTVYGPAGGKENMLDVNLNEDGTASIEPVAAHADLLTAEGTWTATDTAITVTVDGKDIVMTLDGSEKATADAHDFDIADFDTIDFDYYG